MQSLLPSGALSTLWIDRLRRARAAQPFIAATPRPRRRGLRTALPPLHIDEREPDRGISLREWFELLLQASNVSARDCAIAGRLVDGESIRAVAPRARVSAQRVQQIGDKLARSFDARCRTAGALAQVLNGGRREALRERARCTTAADFGRRRDD